MILHAYPHHLSFLPSNSSTSLKTLRLINGLFYSGCLVINMAFNFLFFFKWGWRLLMVAYVQKQCKLEQKKKGMMVSRDGVT